MKPYEKLIEEFYSGFAAGNSSSMISCYHPEIEFKDPVFGVLKAADVKDMWELLLTKSRGNLDIKFSNIISDGTKGSTDWIAEYKFSSTNRKVRNCIHAEFEFKDGLIYRHTDFFDLYLWSKQALGIKGILLGWTPFFKKKIQQQALRSLRTFQRKKNAL